MENMYKLELLSPELITIIPKMIDQMKDKDFMEIPESNGLVLIRRGTETYKERENDHKIMLVEYNDKFSIASK
jgi:hypothetical protein